MEFVLLDDGVVVFSQPVVAVDGRVDCVIQVASREISFSSLEIRDPARGFGTVSRKTFEVLRMRKEHVLTIKVSLTLGQPT